MGRDEMDALRMSALSEIGNVGAGNASTALSSLLGGKLVDISLTDAMWVPLTEVAEVLGGADSFVYAVHFGVEGDLEGDVLFVLDERGAGTAASLMMGLLPADVPSIGELERSALMEMSNIICGSYVSAISTMTGLLVTITPPDLIADMLGAILDTSLGRIGLLADELILLRTSIKVEEFDVKGTFLLLLDEERMAVLLRALGLPL